MTSLTIVKDKGSCNFEILCLPAWRKRQFERRPERPLRPRNWKTGLLSSVRQVTCCWWLATPHSTIPTFTSLGLCLRDRFIYLLPFLSLVPLLLVYGFRSDALHTHEPDASPHASDMVCHPCPVVVSFLWSNRLPATFLRDIQPNTGARKSSLLVDENRWIEREMGPSWIQPFTYYFESDWWPSAGSSCPRKPLPFCRLHRMLVSQSNKHRNSPVWNFALPKSFGMF